MKKNLFIVLFSLLAVTSFAKSPSGDKVDPLIESQFKKAFGNSVTVRWEVIEDISVATYRQDGQENHVYYREDGSIIGFGKTMNKDLLPQAINKAVVARFSSSVIQTVYEFRSSDSPTRYYIRMVSQRHSVIVSANEFGELVVVKRQKA